MAAREAAGAELKLRQLVYFNAVVRHGFNISEAAKALFTSQPNVSRQLQELAEELGVDLFQHQGKRLTGLTNAGREIDELVADVLHDIERIRDVADAHATGQRGDLVVVATRHVAATRLHTAIIRFRNEMPALEVRICEEEPRYAVKMLRSGEAHLGILAELAERHADLMYLPIDEWRLTLVAPEDHAICAADQVTLETLASYSLCAYERTAISRQVVDEAFRDAGIDDPIAFSLGSSETILQYVTEGAGIGLVGEAAFDPARHPGLRKIDISHLFRSMTTDIVLPRHTRPPRYIYRFLRTLDLSLDTRIIEEVQATR